MRQYFHLEECSVFSLVHPLKFLLCNAQILLFLLVPSDPSLTNPPQLIRIDLGKPSVVDTIPLPIQSLFQSNIRSQQNSIPPEIHRIHCDPTGRHVLVSLQSGDNYYVSLSIPSLNQQKTAAQVAAKRGTQSAVLGPAVKHLPKLKGLVITAVGWHFSSYNGLQLNSTKEIILGTSTGDLFTTMIVDNSSQEASSDLSIAAAFSRIDRSAPDRYLKPLYHLPDSPGLCDVTGIWWDAWYQHSGQSKVSKRALAIVTTHNRLYQFVDQVGLVKGRRDDEDSSEGILERLFSSYKSGRVMSKSLELPEPIKNSELVVFQSSISDKTGIEDDTNPTPIVSWLTGAGIYHGEITYEALEAGDGVIVSPQLMPYPTTGSTMEPSSPSLLRPTLSDLPISSATPLSFTCTEYHFVVLYHDRIRVISRLDSQVVHEELLNLEAGEEVIAMTSDPVHHTYWVYSSDSIFEMVVKDEARDVWKIYLSRQAFDMALRFAKNPEDRDKVLIGQADSYLQQRKFIPAAQIYAQCSKSFEEVVLGFIDKGERDALRYYLISRLERLRRQDLTQRMMLATWLTEIYLAKINSLEDMATSEDSPDEVANIKAEQSLIEDELQQFLRTYKANLDLRATYDLITTHGRREVMIYYANLVGDHERIIRHYIFEEDWKKAIESLGRQEDLELYYRFAPVLVNNDVRSATTAFIRQPRLDVKRLIPALILSRSTLARKQKTGSENDVDIVIDYLKFVISRLNNCDAPVHNALLSLYATQPRTDEASLLRFLATTPDNPYTGKPYYDLDYALRVCKANKKLQSCGLIYGKMGLYESSVDLALQTGDLELAKINADKPEDDVFLRKKLWLKIAEYVVHHQKDIKAAMSLLESTDLLKIEDILPFFPDFVVIDDFKQDICDALDNYSVHIQALKQDMEEANRSAELIKSDLSKLSSRFLVINQDDECSLCEETLTTRQFYLFPCQHSFHADCLIKEVTKHMPPHQLRRMVTLQNKLSQVKTDRGRGGIGSEVGSLLSDSKKLALASVQGLDQVRKLIIPDTLVEVIGGGVGALARLKKGATLVNESSSLNDSIRASSPVSLARSSSSNSTSNQPLSNQQRPKMIKSNTNTNTINPTDNSNIISVQKSNSKDSNQKKMDTKEIQKWKDELDELLASKCVLCEWALNSIDKGFILNGEVDI
ncbi:Pep3/Vps18/deep orange family-domain-containing protein [Phakopsora pachyrhizi]|nr:Pep3/Vps18/deep orange family-domain-containing protein [Phakopsora pachyrhizi]